MFALDLGGHIDRLAGLVQRRSLFPRLVRPMLVVMPRVLGEDPPEVSFTVDQQVVKALGPQCSVASPKTVGRRIPYLTPGERTVFV